MENQLTKLKYEQIFDLKSNVRKDCRLLFVGPGEMTSELWINSFDSSEHISDRLNLIQKKNCENCPFRLECKKGRDICNGKLCYKPFTFDKVFLHAEALLAIGNKFEEALRILKAKGEIIVLASRENSDTSEYLKETPYFFDAGQLIKQINNQNLNIQSVSSFKGVKRESLLRFALCK